jgi:hypothetical protein
MIAPPTAPRPAELCANASANGIVVASNKKNDKTRIRRIWHPSKRSISHGCASDSSQDEKEIRQNAFSTSCEATDSPVRAAIECNDDVASVNVALGQVVHNGC